MSYINLINDFWDQNEIQIFKPGEQRLYFYLLKVFNKSGWKRQVNRTNAFIQGELGMSYSSLKRTRDGLKERGLIDFRSQQGKKDVTYSLQPLPEENVPSNETTTGAGDRSGITTQPPSRIRNQGYRAGVRTSRTGSSPPPSSSPSGIYDPDGDHPPDDGVSRNWNDLKRNLNELGVPLSDYQKIVQLSDYGRVGHPVWKAFHEISRKKGTRGAIERPGPWIQWYINQAPPTAAEPAPSPPPEVPDIPADRPPDDGAERNWNELKNRLKELRCPPAAINQIAALSGYGKIGNPVWDALEELRNNGNDVIAPGMWIISYIRENT